jgi:hypothetical protein
MKYFLRSGREPVTKNRALPFFLLWSGTKAGQPFIEQEAPEAKLKKHQGGLGLEKAVLKT